MIYAEVAQGGGSGPGLEPLCPDRSTCRGTFGASLEWEGLGKQAKALASYPKQEAIEGF